MRLDVLPVVLALAAVALAPPPSAAEGRDGSDRTMAAAHAIGQALDAAWRTPGAFPGAAVVVVGPAGARFVHPVGSTRADHGRQVTADTPFYVASETKTYVGLLAAQLDKRGVLRLDTTLAEIWPGLRLPTPANPAAITLRDLLTHQAPLVTQTLNYRTAFTDDVPAASYPALLASETAARKPGFAYSNLGYLIYAAALEARTGRTWRDWLDAEALRPLGLRNTSSRASTYPPGEVSWRHRWTDWGWVAMSPKPDALMHAAGGMFSTPNDLARWMQANLAQSSPSGRPSADVFKAAQRPLANPGLVMGDLSCDGYTLGWMACRYGGERLLMSEGEFTGTRALTVLAPQLGAGISLVINSDSYTGTLEQDLAKRFVDLLAADPEAGPRLSGVVKAYGERPAAYARANRASLVEAMAQPTWGGWAWKPSTSDLTSYRGVFANSGFGDLHVETLSGGLRLRLGNDLRELRPATPATFGAFTDPTSEPEPVVYASDLKSLTWRGRRFERVR